MLLPIIPKNDWAPDPIREDKVGEAIASLVNTNGGTLYLLYGTVKTPQCLQQLTQREIRFICNRFIEAGWHVYRPHDINGDECNRVVVSRLPEDEFNCGAVNRSREILYPDAIKF